MRAIYKGNGWTDSLFQYIPIVKNGRDCNTSTEILKSCFYVSKQRNIHHTCHSGGAAGRKSQWLYYYIWTNTQIETLLPCHSNVLAFIHPYGAWKYAIIIALWLMTAVIWNVFNNMVGGWHGAYSYLLLLFLLMLMIQNVCRIYQTH